MPGRVLAALLFVVISAAGLTVWLGYAVADGMGLAAAWPVLGLVVALSLALGIRLLTKRLNRDDTN